MSFVDCRNWRKSTIRGGRSGLDLLRFERNATRAGFVLQSLAASRMWARRMLHCLIVGWHLVICH